MANNEHIGLLDLEPDEWNEWVTKNIKPGISPDLSYAELQDRDLNTRIFLGADFTGANLTNVNLGDSLLSGTIFNKTILENVNFAGATMVGNLFVDTDLSLANGLESVSHFGPSSLGIDTLYRSGGRIPEVFLRGCGIPDDLITFVPAHFNLQQAIQFYSCFISYSSKDEEFARRLYSRLRDEHLRVWFAPEEIRGGEKLHEQIERAIQIHDRLLLVLSECSMQSEWVMSEIRNARRAEIEQKRRKLFPIRLVSFDALKNWKRFDSDLGKDLAVEIREYFVPDFSNWKDHDAFEESFRRLLRDLRANQSTTDLESGVGV